MKDSVKLILEYNASRKYFGNWSPRQLSDAYHQAEKGCKTESLNIGTLSIDVICDALWNEMTYNPMRFGDKSPFLFNGLNSIESFCQYNFKEDYSQKAKVFAALKTKLTIILYGLQEFDPLFKENGFTDKKFMDIGTVNEYVKTPNKNYEILKLLRECIKDICLQNTTDYDFLLKTNPVEAAKMVNMIRERHPNFIRPEKIENYSLKQRLAQIEKNIKKLTGETESLSEAIAKRNLEVGEIQMTIDTLQEFEEPVDTSHEESKLESQNEEIRKLENILADKTKALRLLKLSQQRSNQKQ